MTDRKNVEYSQRTDDGKRYVRVYATHDIEPQRAVSWAHPESDVDVWNAAVRYGNGPLAGVSNAKIPEFSWGWVQCDGNTICAHAFATTALSTDRQSGCSNESTNDGNIE